MTLKNGRTFVVMGRLCALKSWRTIAAESGLMQLASAMGVVLAVATLIFSGLVFLVNRLTGGDKDVSL